MDDGEYAASPAGWRLSCVHVSDVSRASACHTVQMLAVPSILCASQPPGNMSSLRLLNESVYYLSVGMKRHTNHAAGHVGPGEGGESGRFEMVQTTPAGACSDPATQEGSGVLQQAWLGINEPRCFQGRAMFRE